MDTKAIYQDIKTADPAQIRARLDELDAEQRTLRELLRLVYRARPETRPARQRREVSS